MAFRYDGSSLEAGALWMSERQDDASSQTLEFRVLLERAVAGDHAAFEQILVRHERRVMTVAWRLLGNVNDAQDAAQEVFIRAFRYLHRFDIQKPFEPWLIRMTVNVCRSFGRRKENREKLFSEIDWPDAAPALISEKDDPFFQAAAEQQRKILRGVLADLPEKERTALILRNIEGFSTAEVAEILGSSEATVRVQVSSAIVKIRRAIRRISGGRP
jgi:RNA polymerase sigma-70 factor (ECF subfamily)